MKVRGTTRVLGIFGDPVSHSLSPVMQNEAFDQAGIDAVYVPFHVRPEHLPEAVAAIRLLDLWGVNVTVPHKEAVCAYIDEIDPDAQLIGAVNTIVNREGRLVGYNTDGKGFLRSLEEDLGFLSRGRRILLLGAGGACRAALVALSRAKASWLGIANRTAERAEALARNFGGMFPGTTFAPLSLSPPPLAEVFPRIDLLVNTSSVGLKGDSFKDLPIEALSPGAGVYDMVYSRSGTPLLTAARRQGLKVADGLGMLAAQGEEAFFLWTRRRPPKGLMKSRVLAEYFGKSKT